MLDHSTRAGAAAGITNVTPMRGDARRLPYPSASFDAVFLVTVLGEIGNLGGTITELRRVIGRVAASSSENS
jgi:ubiquinone/menaquinone biosynthesis C-methylase UbiE